jgi:methyl-accepting chemotaxis protein
MQSGTGNPGSVGRYRLVAWFADRKVTTKLAILVGVLLTVTLVVAATGYQSTIAQRRLVQQLAGLRVVGHEIDTLKTNNADFSGYQISYAWDASFLGGAKAVDPTAEDRKGFLGVVAELKGNLAGVHTSYLTASEQSKLASMRDMFTQLVAQDDEIAATYRQNTPQAVEQARSMIMGPSWTLYFKIIDVTNALADSISARSAAVQDRAKQASATALRSIVIALLIGIVLAVALAVLVTRLIARPLARVSEVVRALAAGDLTTRTAVHQRDELGRIASELDQALNGLGEMVSTLVSSSGTLNDSSNHLLASSTRIASAAEETSAQANVVSEAAGTVSQNVQTVAAASEQMGSSIREVARSASEAAQVATSAVHSAEAATATVSKLGASSSEIGNVINVITSIAEQTNLLALNATIEAARAGDAGKGFAVVATEVKDLAQETAKATEDIGTRVQSIQSDATAASQAITEIAAVIERISEFQATIASAVDQQTATTAEMNRNVNAAATASADIAANITGVASAAQDTARGVEDTKRSADDLTQIANRLQETIAAFRV